MVTAKSIILLVDYPDSFSFVTALKTLLLKKQTENGLFS